MNAPRRCMWLLGALACLAGCSADEGPPGSGGRVSLLNVSYDPTREFYRDLNAEFAKDWLAQTGQQVTIKQSHGG